MLICAQYFFRIRNSILKFLLYFPYQRDFSCAILKVFLVMLTYGAASYSSADFLLRVSAALTYGGWGCGFCLLRRGKNYAMIQKM